MPEGIGFGRHPSDEAEGLVSPVLNLTGNGKSEKANLCTIY